MSDNINSTITPTYTIGVSTFTQTPTINSSLISRGEPGPNTITTSTSTDLTGYIYGNGTNIEGATLAYSGEGPLGSSNSKLVKYDSNGVIFTDNSINFGYDDYYGTLSTSSLPDGPGSASWILPSTLSGRIPIIEYGSSELDTLNLKQTNGSVTRIDNTFAIRFKHSNASPYYAQLNSSDSLTNNISLTLPSTTGTIATNNTAVMLTNNQTVNGIKTFNDNIIGNGTSNLFANEAGSSPHSLLTQQQLMLNGHKFRQCVCVNTKKVGALAATVAEPFQVLGMKVSIGNGLSQVAAAYTLDGLFCTDISNTTLPINNEIDTYFHGVAMQFLPEATWKARINFGIPYAKAIPYANQPPATITPSVQQQWGVEFSWNGAAFVGRLYFLYDTPIQYGDYFNLPLYQGANFNGWGGFVYSIRMRQIVIAQNTLRLEFYMNDSVSNNGGTQLSKTTPLSTLVTPTITTPNYRFDGKHINFEVASNSTVFGSPPSGQIRMQCTNMYCQFK